MANLWTRLFTWTRGRPVGRDEQGNRYFEERRAVAGRRRRRWVVYAGEVEASRVPPAWHAWLHYTTDAPLTDVAVHPWQKPHLPNLTGTAAAYRPAGHVLAGGKRPAGDGDYVPWR
ncbi:MAG: NADH:ubiquinone oxidoreductase subunit NDUFA12, partial [Alphaproteobacteria bacterium]